MNRNSVISLLIGVVLGAGGYYIVDWIAQPTEIETQPAVAEEPAPLPSVAAEGAMETEEAVAEMPEAEAAEAPPEPAAEPETEP
jgi:hypothetical protein